MTTLSLLHEVSFSLNKISVNTYLVGLNSQMESLRFENEDEDEDEDEAFCFRDNEIFKLFRLQLGRDDEVDCNNIVTPSLSRI